LFKHSKGFKRKRKGEQDKILQIADTVVATNLIN